MGTGYKNNKVCPVERAKRLKREDHWVKTLRKIYPYGLNERARKHNTEASIGTIFFAILRTKQRFTVESFRNKSFFYHIDMIVFLIFY